MRRTTSRGSRHSASRARRVVRPARSRVARSRRPTRPHLSPRQGREITGVLLILIALLGLLALASNAGSILTGIREWLIAAFDRAWFVPVGAALALGAYLLWPKAPRPRPVDVVSGLVAVAALVGIFGLGGHGGSTGAWIDGAVTSVVGPIGAWALLVALLVIGLIVTVHFSPGALVTTMVTAGQAAYAERLRLQNLVSPPAAATKAKTPGKQAAATSADLARSAASFATPVPAPEAIKPWEVEDEEAPEHGETRVHERARDEEPAPVALRVVAEPEDD